MDFGTAQVSPRFADGINRSSELPTVGPFDVYQRPGFSFLRQPYRRRDVRFKLFMFQVQSSRFKVAKQWAFHSSSSNRSSCSSGFKSLVIGRDALHERDSALTYFRLKNSCCINLSHSAYFFSASSTPYFSSM